MQRIQDFISCYSSAQKSTTFIDSGLYEYYTGLQGVDLLLPHLICLSTEPLYQEYRATVITKEIRRQTVCRNISKTSVDYAMDWTARRTGTGAGNGATRSSPVPQPGQSTLWQELPAVRDSGVLETLTPEQCKYQEVRDRCMEKRARMKC